jgi:hypothetical protein
LFDFMPALAIKNKNLHNTTRRKMYLLSLSAECALANKSHTEVCSTVENDSPRVRHHHATSTH